MPEMDGVRFVKALKANPEYSKIPVLIVSSSSNNELKAADCKADGYINKTEFNQEHLLERIKVLLGNA